MRLYAVGLSHRTAPVELRESVDFARRGLDSAISALRDRRIGQETVVLSTCNRAEIYAAADSDATAEAIGLFFSEYHRVSHAEMSRHLYVHRGPDAARHLFRVAAGLDSLVVGEPQILGQVKNAYTLANGLRATGTLTNRLFHSAFAVGKRVRTETGLAEGAVSLSYASVTLARKIFGDLRKQHFVVFGAGEMARLSALHFHEHVASTTIATRRQDRGEPVRCHGRIKALLDHLDHSGGGQTCCSHRSSCHRPAEHPALIRASLAG